MKTQNQEMLSGEVARLLKVHPITVTRMAESGKLRFRLNCYRWKLFRADDVKRIKHEREAATYKQKLRECNPHCD